MAMTVHEVHCAHLLAGVLVGGTLCGCVTRQGPMPLDGVPGSAVESPSATAGIPLDDTDGRAWQHSIRPDGAVGLAPEAWPVRLPMPSGGVGGGDQRVHLVLPPQRAPDRREFVGTRGVGIVQRVLVEELTDSASLERLEREVGFVEWLVAQTLRSELKPIGLHAQGLTPAALVGGGSYELDGNATTPEPTGATARPGFRIFEAAETGFALYVPDTAPRGLVLQMTNLAGNTDWERRLTQSFRAAGWAVLSTFVPDGWALTSGRQLDANDDPRELGHSIAAIVDDRLAEWAYGVEAVLEDLAIRHPAIAQRPFVGIGSSIGAMALPAVSARLNRPFDALVLAAGGADMLTIMRSTAIADSVTPINWRDGRHPDAARWAKIAEAYRASTRLDALHTAPLLRDTPVLQLHAEWDSIVPSATGDLLWEALGRPERWSYRSGHVGLLVFWLPRERSRIVEWVDRAVSRARSSSDGS